VNEGPGSKIRRPVGSIAGRRTLAQPEAVKAISAPSSAIVGFTRLDRTATIQNSLLLQTVPFFHNPGFRVAGVACLRNPSRK
jgi:hypothetical protein